MGLAGRQEGAFIGTNRHSYHFIIQSKAFCLKKITLDDHAMLGPDLSNQFLEFEMDLHFHTLRIHPHSRPDVNCSLPLTALSHLGILQ